MSNPSPTAVARAGFIPVLNPDAVPLFARLFLLKSSQALLSRCSGHRAWWSPSLTLMAMILGHLLGHASLDRVQEFMRCGVADGLCLKGKIISCFLNGCHNTAGLAMARARLTLTWMRKMLTAQSRELQGMVGGFQWHGMSVMLVDGSMATMRSLGNIARCFPPHSNQHGSTYWCQMRVLFVMCLGTGLILHLVMGSAADSEQAQLVRLILFGREDSPSMGSVLWMGDANFGIWRVAAAAQQMKQNVLVRLTGPRAKKLAGRHALVPGCWIEGIKKGAAAGEPRRLERALRRIAKGKLPKRKKPRPMEPRRIRQRRPSFPPLRGDRAAARAQNILEESLKETAA